MHLVCQVRQLELILLISLVSLVFVTGSEEVPRISCRVAPFTSMAARVCALS